MANLSDVSGNDKDAVIRSAKGACFGQAGSRQVRRGSKLKGYKFKVFLSGTHIETYQFRKGWERTWAKSRF